MKGLLVKDFKLLKNQKQILLLAAIFSVVFIVSNQNTTFVLAYIIMMFSSLTVGTISYDDYDHGFPFLFTLPFSRKEYVREKYLLCTILTGVAWFVFSLISLINNIIQQNTFDIMEFAVISVAFFATAIIMQGITIPIQLKFGSEKRQIIVMGLFVVMFFLILGGGKLLQMLTSSANGASAVFLAFNMTPVLIIAGIVICIGIVGLSYVISVRIMEKKEL